MVDMADRRAMETMSVMIELGYPVIRATGRLGSKGELPIGKGGGVVFG
jgi:hypothetical protein